MPLQNRVTPFGAIVAIPEHGRFTGNRGIIHDPATRTLTRRWASRSWLICRCDYRDRRRAVMATRSWTELFFMDEATALAAGHRPCFFCRRRDAEAFRAAWQLSNGGARPLAREIDAVLHAERLCGREKRLHPLPGPISTMPDGAMMAVGDDSFVVVAGGLRRWTPAGYEASGVLSGLPMLLTPPSTWRTLAAGYRPWIGNAG